MITPRSIIKQAIRLGACNDIQKLFKLGELEDVSWDELVNQFFNPKVLEFCQNNQFPSLEMLNEIPTGLQKAYYLYINRDGETTEHNILVAGDSTVVVSCKKPDMIYNIVAMHGAKVDIKASDYAVVHVVEIGEGVEVTFVNKDSTAIRV